MLKPAAAAFAALSLLASSTAEARKPQGPVVIGYVAAFRDMKATMEMTDLGKLTHINISFVNPGKDGSIVTGDTMSCMDTDNGNGNGTRSVAEVREIVRMAHARNVKVLVSLGGGKRSLLCRVARRWHHSGLFGRLDSADASRRARKAGRRPAGLRRRDRS